MNEEVFSQDIRKFLRTLGVTAHREIEAAVRRAIDEQRLRGTETLTVRATVELEHVAGELVVVEGQIALS